MRFLITGTAGFIGFHLARRLLGEGHRVVGFDGMTPYYDVRLKEARHAILARFEAFQPVLGQLEDAEALAAAAELAQPEVIIHLAAQAGVRYSLENPKAYVDSNLLGTWNVLEVAKRWQVQHLLSASSSSVYGASQKVPFEEADKVDEPLTLYAATKKAGELMAHSYAHLWKMPITAFRFFTVYGPWGRPDMALFKFVSAILKGQPIEIYGQGQMRRDFTYVDDLIEAVVRLIPIAPGEHNRVTTPGVSDSLSHQGPYRVVNIGGGQPVGLLPFIDTIEAAVGIPAIRKMLPMQKGDVPQTYASPELLRALTQHVPATSVDQGVKSFVAWYRDYYGV
ncbi:MULTISPECIES: NAD-dependent epimerase/dehydratase family protein [unclassified Xanthobacter]|uniref:NAD-dependent epimerase/dehydratase family protein n=1 Tax=unclassified Xanthobacter TaxID=2623496 RepID=UPI001F1BFA76|nr:MULTISPECIES: NAD-dependent epimerase/dehydratase family protein [unclassified Xanthobacter]